MKKAYIILLQNNYLLMSKVKPQKKGNYLTGVRLFEASDKLTIDDICKWTKAKHNLSEITEVEDWV